MARVWYGSTPADFTMSPSGRIVAQVALSVWTARTGGTQVTDLLDHNGSATSAPASDSAGNVRFQGPDGTTSTLWIDSGQGPRLAVRPVNLPTADLNIGTVGTGTAAATLTPDGDDAWTLDLTLPSAGTDGVNTAAIQAKAVTAAKIADDTITATQIAANAVGSSELADGAVDAGAIAAGAVTAAGIADGAVTPAKQSFGSVLTAGQTAATTSAGKGSCTQTDNTYSATGEASFTAAYTSLAVTVGSVYTARVEYGAMQRPASCVISWRDSGGTLISNSSGNVVPAGTGGVSVGAGVAPAGAASAMLYFITNTGTGSTSDAITVNRIDFWPIRQATPTSAAVELQGYGSPEAVVTAPAASTYVPLDARSRKGRPWVKQSPAGTNRGWHKPAVDKPYRFSGLHIVPPELSAAPGTITVGLNNVFVHMFQAPDDIVVTGMSMASGTNATTGTWFARFGLWHVGDHADPQHKGMSATLLARTASDTGIFASGSTAYTRSWDATGGYPTAVRLRKGEWYAGGYGVRATGAGHLIGPTYPRSQVQLDPVMSWRTGGFGDMPDLWPMVGGSVMVYDGGATAWMRMVVDQASIVAEQIPVALLGDSIPSTYAGWFSMANAQSGSRLLPILNAGVSGEQMSNINARIPTQIAPVAPDVVILCGGHNDVDAGVSAETIQSRFTAAFTALAAAGVPRVICCTMSPKSTWSEAQKTVLSTVNTWLKGLSSVAGLTVVDTGMALTTGDGVTADASKLADTIHPNLAGQQAMADVLDDVLAAL